MEKIKLGDLCNPCQGQIKVQPGTIIDYIDISSIDNNSKTVSGYQTMTFAEAPSRARKAVKEGNILVSTVRPNLNAVAIVEDATPNMTVASTGFCVLDCKENVDKRFVFNFCKSKAFIDEMVAQATGASYPAVSDKIVRTALIPSYSFHDQIKIGEILDKVSLIIAKRKSELTYLDNLVKARFVEMFGDEKKLMTMDEVCSIITDGTHQPPKFKDTGIPFIFVSNITGDKITYDAEKFIDQDTYDVLIKRTPIEIGDILLSTVGSYGHPAVVKTDKRFLFQRHIAYLKPKKELVDSDYLHGAILSPDAQRQIEKGVKGIAQKTLNLSEIKKMKIPVPSLDRQKEFAVFVLQVDKSKAVIQKSLEEAQLLFDSLMQQYFG